MEEYPDPDEEYELMHADELEVMNEFEDPDFEPPVIKSLSLSKRSLDFSSPTRTPVQSGSGCIASQSSATPIAEKLQLSSSSLECSVIEDQVENKSASEGINNISSSLNENEETGIKRKVTDLFGDIDDINFDDEFNENTKRTKTDFEEGPVIELSDEQRMDITIQKILTARQQFKVERNPVYSEVENIRIEKKLPLEITRRVPQYPFISLNTGCNNKVYLRFRSEDEFNLQIEEFSKRTQSEGLLSIPFKTIQKEAAEMIQKKFDAIDENVNNNESSTDITVTKEAADDELWVEKYRPKRYLDLLSDEGTNRSLLKWIKLWDKVVFNKENKITVKQKYEEPKKYGKMFKKKHPENELVEELDELGRPKFKIALLCGPPGLGKTTLAHILARHAGYNVVEVNASDDRTPELFRTQLQAATQMKAVMGKDPRPNCLILDEIDGAPHASIDVVVKFVTTKDVGTKGKSVKKNKKSELNGVLKRPIICICNDVYVPALRPLRQIAFVLHFPPTCSYRLAQRLCEISRLQNLKTNFTAMMALSDKSNNDIRACLALLHCLQSKSGNEIRLTHINNASFGRKDVQKGLFTIWQEIFQIHNPDRWKSVLQTVQGYGDYDRLAQGVYENYLQLKSKGSNLKLISEGLEWFVHYDIFSTFIQATQNYTVYSYLPYPFLKWHFVFATRLWPKLSFPSLGYEMKTKLTRTVGLLDEMLKGMSPQVRPYRSREMLLLDVVSPLLEVIVPNLRPVTIQLYNEEERKELNKVINIMIDYNLCYTQERTQDSSYVFKLDPDIEEVGKFPGCRPIQRVLSYIIRLQIQRELDLEKIRRIEANLTQTPLNTNKDENSSNASQPIDSKMPDSAKKDVPEKTDEPKPVPNHLQRLTPKALKLPSEPVKKNRMFFGRIVEKQSDVSENCQRTANTKDVWFKFKEGYNNAVRLRVNMGDLY